MSRFFAFIAAMWRWAFPRNGVLIVRYPQKNVLDPDTGEVVPCLELAIKIANTIRRGTLMALPSDADPRTGKHLWDVQFVPLGGKNVFVTIDGPKPQEPSEWTPPSKPAQVANGS